MTDRPTPSSPAPLDPRPRILCLFCGAGGDSTGYHRAGFDVMGVDIRPQPHYPFGFRELDVTRFDAAKLRLCHFDAIHAGPPCQWGTAYGRRPNHVKESPNLVDPVRELLEATGLPYVIEQPENNRRALRRPGHPLRLVIRVGRAPTPLLRVERADARAAV